MFWPKIKKIKNLIASSDDLIVNIDKSWSDDHGIYLRGWILHKTEKLEMVYVTVGGNSVPITSWHERPDIILGHPLYAKDIECGFSVYIPRLAEHWLLIKAHVNDKIITKTLNFSGPAPELTLPFSDASNLFNEFIQIVNEKHLKVLEIGSRIVSPGSSSKRPLFPEASSFTGFDIYPDSNTDVVGDAHKLSQYFGEEKFDAVFSLSVFEHLAMPWVVAKEINKVMKIGGFSFHASHFSWPIHEIPWDFYRYSDEGFKALFPPSMGFKTIKSGLFAPMRMYYDNVPPGQEELPFFPGFGGVGILSEKISDVDCKKFNWDTSIEEILDKESAYPKK
jgi:hypothetical protein